MRIEDINADNVKSLSKRDLKNLRERMNQLYRKSRVDGESVRKRMVGVATPIRRDTLMESYVIVSNELEDRDITLNPADLDKKMVRKKLRGIDVGELPPIVVKEGVVCLSGGFVTSPRQTKSVEVRIDAGELDEIFTQALEKRMVETFMDQTGKSVIVRRDAEGLESPVIPVFDLVMVPRPETTDQHDVEGLQKRLESLRMDDLVGDGVSGHPEDDDDTGDSGGPALNYISKPYPGEHAAAQLDSKKFTSFARKNNHFGSGIHAIFGIKGGKSKVVSIRFSDGKFTPAQARTWLKSHKYKTGVEAAVKKESTFIKSEEERIVGGIVYTAMEVDKQGDYAAGPEIYAAMKNWMVSTGGRMKIMHEGRAVTTPIVECFYTDDRVLKNGEAIPEHSWYICAYIPPEQEELWKAVKEGKIAGFSMSGSADMVMEDVDEPD